MSLFNETERERSCDILGRDAVLIRSRSTITAQDGKVDFRFTTACLAAEELQPLALPDNTVIMHRGAPVRAHCVLDGRSRTGIQRPGDFDVIPAKFIPRRQGDAPAEVFHMTWSPRFVGSVLEEPASLTPRPDLQLRDPHLQGITSAILAEHLTPSPFGQIYTESLMTAFVARLASIQHQLENEWLSADRFSPVQERRLIDFIEENLASDLSLISLATTTGYGLSRFKTLFRNTFGCTAHQHILNRRTALARHLVMEGKLPLNEIALEAGFSHQSHMATVFRREFGVTPGQMRRLGAQ